MSSIRLVTGLFAAVAFSIVGCAGSSFSSGAGGSAGKQNDAGTSSGGSGNDAGMSSGGSGNDAGTDSGGTSAGVGGSAGQMAGGTGGSSAGGAGGGRGGSCRQDSDCVACAYPTAPRSAVDCYCATCNDVPMAKATCDANRAEFEKVCNVPMVCPAIACVKPPDPVCDRNMCVAGTSR